MENYSKVAAPLVKNFHYLLPSALYVARKPTLVDTVLGTCIAVCLYDETLKAGGINHYMLPYWNGEGLASPKYGNIANELLVQRMENMGCRRRNLVAKVFGGKEPSQADSQFTIGIRNYELAQEQLEEMRIPIVAKSIGGQKGRKIVFHTNTGAVRMKFLNK